MAFTKTQAEQPTTGTVCARWLNIWQNGLAPSVLMHTGTVHSSLLLGAPGSPQKRCWDTVISVLGCGLTTFLERLDLRAGTVGAGGVTHAVFTVTSGSPACSTKVGMILSTGRPEACASTLQKSSAVALA